MSVALVGEAATVPAPSTLTVADAYRQLRELVPAPCLIDWMSDPCGGGCGHEELVRRFSRGLEAEVWLAAWPVDDAGEPVRGAGIGVAVLAVAAADARHDVRGAVEARLRRELEQAKEADDGR